MSLIEDGIVIEVPMPIYLYTAVLSISAPETLNCVAPDMSVKISVEERPLRKLGVSRDVAVP